MKQVTFTFISFLIAFSLFAQNKIIDPAGVTFSLQNAASLSKEEAAIQHLSKTVAAYFQEIKDSSWVLKDIPADIQMHLYITCAFASGNYNGLTDRIHQYRKSNKTPYLQKVGKAYIESYIAAFPFKNDSLQFKKKYEETFSTLFQKTTLEDLPRIINNKKDAENANAENTKKKYLTAVPADTAKSISFRNAITLIFAYVDTKFSGLQDAELSVYKKQIAKLENSVANPVAAKYTLPVAPIAITHVNIVNVITGNIDADQTILINKNKIIEVGTFKKIKIPHNATLIDAMGKYAMPGMTDGHIHFFQSGGLYTRPDGINVPGIYPYEKDQQWIKENMYDLMARYIACGVTNVIDVGGPMSNFEIRERVNNEITSPNALVTGPLISTLQPKGFIKDNLPIIKASTAEEAISLIIQQLPYKPDFIKIWYLAENKNDALHNLPMVKAAIDETHRNGLKACVHATEYETAKLAVEAGADILVHSIDDKLLDEPFLQLLKTKNVTYIPTLQVYANYMRLRIQNFSFEPHDYKYANPFMLGSTMDLKHINPTVSGIDYNYFRTVIKLPNAIDTILAKNLLFVSKAGINVVAGTDAGNIGTHHGSSFLKELEMMKSAGLSEWEILKSCTINAATGFGKEKEWGSIEKNKIADILLLDKNPLLGLSALNYIPTVIHRGVILKTDELLPSSPEILVQRQLNAYNARDINAFLEPYADSVELYQFPGTLLSKGKEQMRQQYESMFKNLPGLHCELKKRIIKDNFVIDHESITGIVQPQKIEAIAHYEIENNKIIKVYFIQ